MTTRTTRVLVVALAGALTCSLALGAAAPVAASGVLVGDSHPFTSGLGLGGVVGDAVDEAGDLVGVDGTNATGNGTFGNGTLANGTLMNGTVANDTLTNGTVANDTLTNGTVANGTDDGTVANGTDDGTAAEGTSDATVDRTPTPESTPGGPDAAETDDTVVGDVGETVEAVGNTTSRTVNETTSATTDAVDGTVNGTGETVAETVNATGGTVDETVNATGTTAVETVNATGEAMAGATDATGETVTGATNGTTGAVENVTGEVTGNATGDVTRTVDDVVAATTNGTTDATTGVTGTVDGTVSSTTGAVGNVTAVAANLTTIVDDGGALVRQTTGAVTDAVVGTVETTGTLIEGVVAGTVGGGADPGTAGTHGWPTAGDESAEDRGGHWAGDGADGSTGERVDLDEGAAATGGDDPAADADGTDGAAASDGPAPRGPTDPDAGGAAVGAALVVGSLVATRTGMAAATTGGAAGLMQALFATLRSLLLRVAVLAGYSRYDFEDPLENENRAAVLETVESSPGINLTSLVEETGLSESTVRYHLRVLEHEDLLEGAKVRGRRRYVPRTDEDLELLAAFEEEATRDVLAALFEHEPATGTTLAEALERDPSTVSHHLSRLADAGLVDREQDGPALRNSLAPEVRRAFSEVEVTASVQGHARADD